MPTATEIRKQRGQQISLMENAVSRMNETDYIVKSQTGIGEYHVGKTLKGWICQCPDFTFRGWDCKHIYAVQYSQNLREEVKQSVLVSQVSITQCLFCKSEKLIKAGVRHNKSGDIQKYECLICHRQFTFNIGFERMKHNPQAITSAMQLYFSGESLRNTQKSLRLLGVEVSHKTVYKWIQKYCTLMQSYAEKIQPKVSSVWRADEIYVKVKGDQKYLFALMDDETRYWIAQEVANTKQNHDATHLFRESKRIAGKSPIRLITDGLGSYANAYDAEFKNPARQTEHIREIAITGKIHNNKMERMNGEIRDREKTMRGLKNAGTPILTGYQIFHNFIRPHSALGGKTPAEACGVKIEGSNKWKTLIQNASLAPKNANREKLEEYFE